MLRSEFRKTWSRPVLLGVLIAACLAQILYVSFRLQPDIREVSQANNAYAGTMDDAWRERVLRDFDSVWGGTEPSQDAYWLASHEERAVLSALGDVYFTEKLDRYVDALKAKYSTDPQFDLMKIDAAYAKLRAASEADALGYGVSPAANSMTDQMLICWSFVFVMMILCVDQFSGEKTTGMECVLSTTRNGRKKLFWTKFTVCQLSALMVWMLCNGVYAVTLTAKAGWGVLSGIIQDFAFNACPFVWNSGQRLAVVLSFGLIASQLVAMVMFLISSVSKTAMCGFSIITVATVIPMLMAKQLDIYWIQLLLPCLMHNAPMWSGWAAWRIGQIYFTPWTIATIEVIVIGSIGIWALRRGACRAEQPYES